MSPGRKKPSKKATARKKPAARKKPTARKGTARKGTARKKVASRKKKATARKKPAARKKPTARKGSKKPAAKKTAAKKPAARKAAAKKPPVRPARAAPPPRRRRVRPAKLDAASLRQIEQELREEREDLRRRETELGEAAFGDTQSDITGEVGLDEDFADAGTATFERERDLSIRNNIRDLIDQIERALARISDGTYGSCERCGNPIDAARLKALPHALLCMDCKRREERAR